MAYNTAMPSGYDYDFVQEVPDDYICIICHLVMKNPVQTECGHQFCKECLQEATKRNPECPEDRQPLTPQDMQNIFEDKAMGRKIMSLVIKCPEQGCNWQGELRDIENHKSRCDYKVVDCENESCSVRKPRHEMVAHAKDECVYRMVACPQCKDTYVFRLLEEHTSECPQSPVSCPNNCGETITREQVTSHTSKQCPLTIVPCSYENIGCTTKLPKRGLKDHMENYVEQHLAISIEHNLTLQKEIDEMKKKHIISIQHIQKEIDDVKKHLKSCENIVNGGSYIWNVKDFSQQLQTAKQKGRDITLYSEPFYTHKYGYKMKLQLYPNGHRAGKGTHVSVFLVIMRGEYDAVLTWPFNWNYRFILIDQKPVQSQRMNVVHNIPASVSHESFQRPTTDENTGYGTLIFVSHETLDTEEYVIDGGLYLKLELEEPKPDVERTLSTMIQDDERHYSYIWKVKDFSQQLQTAKQTGRNIKLYSEPFYTHSNGYKMKLRLDPNGDGAGKGTHVSVFLVVMRGEYDGLLTWPFEGKYKFILMDQKPDPSQRKNIEPSNVFINIDPSLVYYQRPTTNENLGIGYHQFVSHKTLEKEDYVVDGTLFLKLEIEMA